MIFIKHVVLISGGKDSTATLFKVLEEFKPNEIIALFNDTLWEHPDTYKYIEELVKFTGVNLITTKPDRTLLDILKMKLLNYRIRSCTDTLKQKPLKKYLRSLKDEVIIYYGIRKDESINRSKKHKDTKPDELYVDSLNIKKQKVMAKYPIIDFTKEDVFNYIEEKGFYRNPLYDKGFDRVGCYPCICANKKNFEMCMKDEIGRENIKQILDVVFSNHSLEEIEKTSDNYIRYKKIYDKYKDEY